MAIKFDVINFWKLNDYLMTMVENGAKLVVRTYNGAVLVNNGFKYYIYSKKVIS